MSVTYQLPLNSSVAAPGATLFPYDFKVLLQSDLYVEVDGVEKVADVDFTVTGVGDDAGGDITFIVPMVGGERVIRKREMAFQRLTDFQQLGDLRSSTLNNDQDAPILMIQQVNEEVSRSVRLPAAYSAGVSLLLPAPVALSPLVWNAAGTALENGSTTMTGDMLLRGNLADASTPGYGARLVAWMQSGASAVVQWVLDELRRTIRPEHYGAVGDGVTDDRAAIVAALTEAAARGGANVQLLAKSYAISAGFTVPSGCGLIGKGSGQYPAAGFAASANFKATAKTRIVAKTGFPAGTYMVDATVSRGNQYTLQACHLEGLLIDGDTIAERLLRWRGIKNSRIVDVGLYRPGTTAACLGAKFDTAQGGLAGQTAVAGGASTITFGAALASPRDDWFNGATITTTGGTGSGQTKTVTDYNGTTKVATVDSAWSVQPDATTVFTITGECLEGNGATQFNLIDGFWVWLGNTGNACGIEFDGDGAHDCNQNSYRNLRVIHADGPGIRMLNGDTDWLNGVTTYAFGNGNGLEMHGSETTSYEGYCRQQFLTNCLFGGANVGGRSNTAQAGAGLTITLDTGANATDDYYNGKFVEITGGTGVGQRRKISDYTGSSKVALVSEAWTTNPDATSTFTINGGGGVAIYKGAYRTSRWHTFGAYETEGNGAGGIYAEDGGAYIIHGERAYDLNDVDGFDLTLGASNAFATGTSSKLLFFRKILGKAVEMSSIREFTNGAEATANGALLFFTRKAGAAPTEAFRIGDGYQVNGGTLVKRTLSATANLDFGSIAAHTTADLTITVTGCAVNDSVSLGPPSAPVAGISYMGFVSATNTVTVRCINHTAAAIDPALQTFRATTIGFT